MKIELGGWRTRSQRRPAEAWRYLVVVVGPTDGDVTNRLHIRGAVVTIDAMGCQKGIAKKLVDNGAEAMLAVKENQPTLHDELIETFRGALEETNQRHRPGYSETQDVETGVIEMTQRDKPNIRSQRYRLTHALKELRRQRGMTT